MPRITDFIIIETDNQPVLTIEKTVTPEEIVPFFVESIYKIGDFIKTNRLLPADVEYMRVNVVSDILTVTVGTAVITPLVGIGEIKSDIIPAGKKVVCYYQGSNNEMDSFYQEMETFIIENGYERVGAFYEHFLNGPEYGTEKLLTKVVALVK